VKYFSALIVLIAIVSIFVFRKKQPLVVPEESEVNEVHETQPKVPAAKVPAVKIAAAKAAPIEKLSQLVATSETTQNSAPLDNDDLFEQMNLRYDYFDAKVIPKMKSLPSPCKIICAPSSYDSRIMMSDPEYDKKFFEPNPEAAFADPEFRLEAESAKNASVIEPKSMRDEYHKADSEFAQFPDDPDKEEALFATNKAALEARKKYSQSLKEIDAAFEKFRSIRTRCNTENPSDLEKECLQALSPDGQFPKLHKN
jgi:hypothetical protein